MKTINLSLIYLVAAINLYENASVDNRLILSTKAVCIH